jgi:glycine/D-amino acid oxidase-like deaminating enzyme/nitrite reductase/ring-hydroxylating ferredoxin subunit
VEPEHLPFNFLLAALSTFPYTTFSPAELQETVMTLDTQRSTSVWMDTQPMPVYSRLMENTETDVCIVGSGIAGLTSAYLLSREGKRVVVLEAREVCSGETSHTTAHLAVPDNRFYAIEAMLGAESSRLVADSFGQATALVESICAQEDIDCGFTRVKGYLYSRTAEGRQDLEKEYEAALRAGAIVQKLDKVPELSFDTGTCLEFAEQGQFHPLRYLAGLCKAIERMGGRIYTYSRALDIENHATGQRVTTANSSVHAQAVVIATNTPFINRVVMHTKQAGYMSYVVAFQIPKGSVPRILLWDTGDPYFYVRLAAPRENTDQHDLLIVGGQDHKVGQDVHPEHCYAEIEQWTRQHYPMAGAVAYRWSGEVMEPSDGVAYLGRNPADDNVYIITGDSGNGMTHCTAGAMLITDLIMGRDNPWQSLYDPARKPTHAIKEFVHEQANTLIQYKEWVTPAEVDSEDQIAPGQGAILRRGLSKMAVYRDENGQLHARSAVCTHLGCIVTFNSAEKSWDCPCHASRFGIDGEALHGPANTPLGEA